MSFPYLQLSVSQVYSSAGVPNRDKKLLKCCHPLISHLYNNSVKDTTVASITLALTKFIIFGTEKENLPTHAQMSSFAIWLLSGLHTTLVTFQSTYEGSKCGEYNQCLLHYMMAKYSLILLLNGASSAWESCKNTESLESWQSIVIIKIILLVERK